MYFVRGADVEMIWNLAPYFFECIRKWKKRSDDDRFCMEKIIPVFECVPNL